MPLWKLENGIHAGKILKAHGYLGIVKVAFVFSGVEEIISEGDFVFLDINQKPVPFKVESVSFQNEVTALIKFADVENDKDAGKLKDLDIILESDKQLKILSSEPPFEWEGYKVIEMNGKLLGNACDLIDNGFQSLLMVMQQNGNELLIPVHEDIVKKADKRKKTIIVNLPEGLINLNEKNI